MEDNAVGANSSANLIVAIVMFSWMMNKKSERGSQKAAASEAANLSETTGPSGIKPSGTSRICLELREEENELKIAGLSVVEAEQNEDAKIARLLQEEYWKSMKQKKKVGVVVHNRYLRVKEFFFLLSGRFQTQPSRGIGVYQQLQCNLKGCDGEMWRCR